MITLTVWLLLSVGGSQPSPMVHEVAHFDSQGECERVASFLRRGEYTFNPPKLGCIEARIVVTK